MRQVELLAPARDIHIGIAAIDCGADAVYIAGPQFGARQAASNSIEDIRELCSYAHRFGARIFVALNTILYDDELEAAFQQILEVQNAGADALIIQDLAIIRMAELHPDEIRIPLHASTQCAIRTPQQAAFLEGLGFSRLILERELSLEQIREIRAAVSCELEFFVHGALCVCYSGQCYLSEKIAGRSANRGACIQACRSRYDLVDSDGKLLVRDKAMLSLKDYNLKAHIAELAEAGISSFKIEGRLKNESYVKNVVRDYSLALDSLCGKMPFERASFGKVYGGFAPDTYKTFNRDYTSLFIDGRRGKWAAMDAAKSMGEYIGEVSDWNGTSIILKLANRQIVLNNGDGFCFVAKNGDVVGFRGDVCTGNKVQCKRVEGLFKGAKIYRNVNIAFERELERQACTRLLAVKIALNFEFNGSWKVQVLAKSEDRRCVSHIFEAGEQSANNRERMAEILKTQICKSSGDYIFSLESLKENCELPFMTASFLNGIRRQMAALLDSQPCGKKEILLRKALKASVDVPAKEVNYKFNIANKYARAVYSEAGAQKIEEAYELSHCSSAELMRSKYCIRYELGLCPKHNGAKAVKPLFLLNNGRRFALHFDCRNCEMVVSE